MRSVLVLQKPCGASLGRHWLSRLQLALRDALWGLGPARWGDLPGLSVPHTLHGSEKLVRTRSPGHSMCEVAAEPVCVEAASVCRSAFLRPVGPLTAPRE